MVTLKKYCEQNNLDPEKVLDLCIGDGGSILPQKMGMQGYLAIVHDTHLTFVNDKLGVDGIDVYFADFNSAEFGIGSGNLWLQCQVGNSSLVFCTTRGNWKSAKMQKLIDTLEAQLGTSLREDKDYKHFVGNLFWLYMLK